MISGNVKRIILVSALSAASFSMALSVWLLSLFTILSLFAFIADDGISRIRSLFREKRIVLVFMLSYLVYVIWLPGSDNMRTGLIDLRLKLPILVFPLIFGFSKPLSRKELVIIISSFILGVTASSASGAIKSLSAVVSGEADSRILSPFISHIRLSLMAVFAIACSGWIYLAAPGRSKIKLLCMPASLWLLCYLLLLFSVTGIVLIAILLTYTAFFLSLKHGTKASAGLVTLFFLLSLTVAALLLTGEVKNFLRPGVAYPFPLKDCTLSGNPYWHDTARTEIENGNRVWLYISEKELRDQWNGKSSFKYDSLDRRGQMLKHTLIRYMTSAGLTKDSAGVASLSPGDFTNIEKGITNIMFGSWKRWKIKTYEIIWQIDYYRKGGNPSGHSLTQRIEFLKTGWRIFRQHPFLGTGTGDIRTEFDIRYERDHSPLDPAHRLLSHNQYLTFLVSFGITGLLVIMFSVFFPFIRSGSYRRYLPSLFLLLIVLSMLWEDTLETHIGVSFFAYFYGLLIFGTTYDE
jgi:hypothetical protein